MSRQSRNRLSDHLLQKLQYRENVLALFSILSLHRNMVVSNMHFIEFEKLGYPSLHSDLSSTFVKFERTLSKNRSRSYIWKHIGCRFQFFCHKNLTTCCEPFQCYGYFSPKHKECKDIWKPSKPCHVDINWIALFEFSQMSTHVPGFQILLFFTRKPFKQCILCIG